MQPLTKREGVILDAMLADPERVWDVEGLAGQIWRGEEPRPPSWRKVTLDTMKLLRIKTSVLLENRVLKVSRDRGRGNVGKYALRKTARKFGLVGE